MASFIVFILIGYFSNENILYAVGHSDVNSFGLSCMKENYKNNFLLYIHLSYAHYWLN